MQNVEKKLTKQRVKTQNKPVTLYFDFDISAKLRRISENENISMSLFVNNLIMEYKEKTDVAS